MRHRRSAGRSGRRRSFGERLRYAFRERQIYLRSEGEVQFITLRPKVQVCTLVGLMVGMFWLAYSTINFVFKDQLLSLKERNMYQARLDYEDRIAAMRTSIDRLNSKLMIDQNGYLNKVDEVRAEYDKLVERHGQLTEFFRQGWMPTHAKGKKNNSAVQPTEDPQKSDGTDSGSSGKSGLNHWTFRQLYAKQFQSKRDALKPLSDSRAMFAKFEDMQVALLDDVVDLSSTRLAKTKQIFTRLGMNPTRVATTSSHAPAEAIGGPFVSVTAAEVGSQRVAERMSKAMHNLVLAEKLRFEAAKLPLSYPIRGNTSVSSGFGVRKDPFRRTAAMHAGIDFLGTVGTLIRATAAGVVARAGWDGAYGRTVLVRHGNGVSTRYAHMQAIKVKVGDRVELGTIVGTLGSTGRSTGPHLHYETRIHGRAYNPRRFWKARHALQRLSQ